MRNMREPKVKQPQKTASNSEMSSSVGWRGRNSVSSAVSEMPPVWRKLHRQYIKRRNVWHLSKIMCYLRDRDHCILKLMVYNAKRKNIPTAFLYSHAFPVCDYLGHLSPGSLISLGPGTCAGPAWGRSFVSARWAVRDAVVPQCSSQERHRAPLSAPWRWPFPAGEHLSIPSDTVSSRLTDFLLFDSHWLNPHGKPPFGFWSEATLPLLSSALTAGFSGNWRGWGE